MYGSSIWISDIDIQRVSEYTMMPRKCSVTGSRRNYAARKGEPADVNKVGTFHFPKDVSRKSNGCIRCPRSCVRTISRMTSLFVRSTCELCFVMHDMTCYRPDGSLFTCATDIPIPAPDAVLTLFPNTPSYLSIPLPAKRKAP